MKNTPSRGSSRFRAPDSATPAADALQSSPASKPKLSTAAQAAAGLGLLLALQWGTLAERAPDQGAWGQKAADLMRQIAPSAQSGSAESAFETRLARSAQGDAEDAPAEGSGDDSANAEKLEAQGGAGVDAKSAEALALDAASAASVSLSAASAPIAQAPLGRAGQQAQGALSLAASPHAPEAGKNAGAGPSAQPPSAGGLAALSGAVAASGQKQLFLVAGDSLGDGYGQAARARFPRQSAWEAFDAGRHSTGLANAAYHDWPRALRELVKQRRPQAVGLSVGANDTLDLRTDSGWAHFGSDAWKAEYLARAKAFIRAGSEAGAKVAVFGLPPMQNAAFNQKMRVIDRVLEQAAQEENAVYVPANPVFGQSAFAREGVVNGRRSALRAGDGIHMTFAGYTVEVNDAIKALGIDADAPRGGVAAKKGSAADAIEPPQAPEADPSAPAAAPTQIEGSRAAAPAPQVASAR